MGLKKKECIQERESGVRGRIFFNGKGNLQTRKKGNVLGTMRKRREEWKV